MTLPANQEPGSERRRGGAATGTLTSDENIALQAVADQTGLPFSVVGERGRQVGRNITTTFPFGAGAKERSPIELAFPAEYDLLTGGGFTETLYGALDAILQIKGLANSERAFYQASHMWPPDDRSIDFYPQRESRLAAQRVARVA